MHFAAVRPGRRRQPTVTRRVRRPERPDISVREGDLSPRAPILCRATVMGPRIVLRLVFRFFGFLFSWLAIGVDHGARGAGGGLRHLRQGSARLRPARALRAADAQPHLFRRGRADGRVRPRAADLHARSTRSRTRSSRRSSRPRTRTSTSTTASIRAASSPRSTTRPRTASRLRGASTITQQVMKNFLLTGDRSGERKIKEIILATRLESTLSKDEILELYLNEIFLGQNSYGVTAAAQVYFAKSLEELTPGRDRLSRGAAAGAERAAPGAREGPRDRPAQLRARADGARTATSPARRPRRPRRRTC